MCSFCNYMVAILCQGSNAPISTNVPHLHATCKPHAPTRLARTYAHAIQDTREMALHAMILMNATLLACAATLRVLTTKEATCVVANQDTNSMTALILAKTSTNVRQCRARNTLRVITISDRTLVYAITDMRATAPCAAILTNARIRLSATATKSVRTFPGLIRAAVPSDIKKTPTRLLARMSTNAAWPPRVRT